jgi:hypothetical protein
MMTLPNSLRARIAPRAQETDGGTGRILSVNRRRKRLARVNLRRRIVLRQRLTAEADHYCPDHTRCAENHSPPPVRRFANEVSYESGRIQDISRKKFTKELMLPAGLVSITGPAVAAAAVVDWKVSAPTVLNAMSWNCGSKL